MKQAWLIRSIWIKREWKSFLFWLCLPLLGSILCFHFTQSFIDEVKVPVGVVVEDDSSLAQQLVEQLQQEKSLDIRLLREKQALNQLEQHELDSVFIIKKHYEENIHAGKKRLIEGYFSNRSYAYFAVVEIVTSYAQEQATRAKLLTEVERLLIAHHRLDLWEPETVLAESKARQYEQDLIQIEFSIFEGVTRGEETSPFITIWSFWSVLSILATFFLFDWLVKERKNTLRARWLFANLPFSHYALYQLILYTLVLFSIDLLFMLYQQAASWPFVMALFAFRCTLGMLAFFIAHLFKQVYAYYVTSIFITGFAALLGGGFIPLDGVASWTLLRPFNPIYALLKQQIAYGTTSVLVIGLVLYVIRGKWDATSNKANKKI